MPIPIKIEKASVIGTGGSITNATITGDATIPQQPPQPGGPVDPGYDIDKDEGYVRPGHPILLPPTSDNPEAFYVLVYFPPTEEGGKGHWEWVCFMPGSPPTRPKPQPPEPPTTVPPGEKPFPPDGGWGYKQPYGWIYWPGPEGAGPKKR